MCPDVGKMADRPVALVGVMVGGGSVPLFSCSLPSCLPAGLVL